MQLLVLATCLAMANGLALYASYPLVYSAQGSALITPTQQQYLTQDALGQYEYGYSEPHSSKQEVHSLDGTTQGTYSYKDAEGKRQTVNYIADASGFHVAATNLPRAVQPQNFPGDGRSAHGVATADPAQHPTDSVEVAAARRDHFAAHEQARLRLAKAQQQQQLQQSSQPQPDVELPQPVADTAEVANAKSTHLKRLETEKIRNELLSSTSAVPVAVAAVAPRSHVVVPLPSLNAYSFPGYYTPRFYY